MQLPGKIRSLNVWIWGSNYNYSMDLHLQDYRGVVHVLRLGKLEFNGWGILLPVYHHIFRSLQDILLHWTKLCQVVLRIHGEVSGL